MHHLALFTYAYWNQGIDIILHWRSSSTTQLDLWWAITWIGFESKTWVFHDDSTKLWTYSFTSQWWWYSRLVYGMNLKFDTMNKLIYVFFIGLNHLGVLKCLHSARLLPRIISGASSGSIMAAMLCTKTDEEIPQMFNPAGIQLVSNHKYLIYIDDWHHSLRMYSRGKANQIHQLCVFIDCYPKDSYMMPRSCRMPCEAIWVISLSKKLSTEHDGSSISLWAHQQYMTCRAC